QGRRRTGLGGAVREFHGSPPLDRRPRLGGAVHRHRSNSVHPQRFVGRSCGASSDLDLQLTDADRSDLSRRVSRDGGVPQGLPISSDRLGWERAGGRGTSARKRNPRVALAGAEGLFADGLRNEGVREAAQDVLNGTGIWAEGSEIRDLRLELEGAPPRAPLPYPLMSFL